MIFWHLSSIADGVSFRLVSETNSASKSQAWDQEVKDCTSEGSTTKEDDGITKRVVKALINGNYLFAPSWN